MLELNSTTLPGSEWTGLAIHVIWLDSSIYRPPSSDFPPLDLNIRPITGDRSRIEGGQMSVVGVGKVTADRRIHSFLAIAAFYWIPGH